MIILALDTTTRGGSVAVTDDDRVLALLAGDASRTHGERFPGEIARALEPAGVTLSQIDLLAVATGPGAFTGLRIGLATIQGLAMTLDAPVVGVSALDALADQVTDEVDLILPWMDAQRGDVFATLIDRPSRTTIETPATASPRALVQAWLAHLSGRSAVFIGDAAVRDEAIITPLPDGRWARRLPEPLAANIARLALPRARQGLGDPPHALEPIYVRRPDAEIERERRRR